MLHAVDGLPGRELGGCLQGTRRSRSLGRPEPGCFLGGQIVAKVAQKYILCQVQAASSGRRAGIRKLFEEFTFRLRLRTESDPPNEPVVSPTARAAASTFTSAVTSVLPATELMLTWPP